MKASKIDNATVSVCVSMELKDDWTLDDVPEPVKVYLGDTPPTSNPGSYPFKQNTLSDFCVNLNTTNCTIYFALHLDVRSGSGSRETAWALNPTCPQLIGYRFVKESRRLASPNKKTSPPTKKPTTLMPTKKPTTLMPTTSPPTIKPTTQRSDDIGWGMYFSLDMCSCPAPAPSR